MKEKLKQHLDVTFSRVPKTQKNEELKEELLANLYDKYDEFLANGMTEENAFRATVNSIGDLSELLERKSETPLQDEKPKESPDVLLYGEEGTAKKTRLHALGTAIAVMLYICSIFPVILWEDSLWSVVGLFLICAIATGILIYGSNTQPIFVSVDLSEEQKAQLRKKRSRSAILLAACVGLYILCVSPVILLERYEKLGIILMFLMIAVATVGIILRTKLLAIEEPYSPLPSDKKSTNDSNEKNKKSEKKDSPAEKLFSLLAGIFWLCVCGVYLLYSFLSGNWGFSWLIFVGAAFLLMLVRGVFDLAQGKHRVGAIVKIIIASLLLFSLLSSTLVLQGGIFSFGFESDSLMYDERGYSVGSKSFEADQSIKQLDIAWVDGAVRVCYWDNDYVSIAEQSTATLAEDDQMRYRLSGETLSIKFCAPRWGSYNNASQKELTVYLPKNPTSGQFEILNSLTISNVSSDIELDRVLASYANLDAVSGKIELTDCAIEFLEIDSVSGEVRMSGRLKELDLDTVSGNVTLSLQNTPNEISLDCVSADVTVVLPSDILGFSVEFDSASGRLSAPDGGSLREDEYVYGNGTAELQMDSASGDLTVKLADEAK